MQFRVLTALAILSAGVAVPFGAADAQSFPSLFRPFQQPQVQPVQADDDDLEPPSGTLSPPGIQAEPLPAPRTPYPDYSPPGVQPQYLPRPPGPQFSQPAASYPQQGGYQQQAAPQQGYPQQGGYQQQAAPQQGYPQQQGMPGQQVGTPTAIAPQPGFIFPDDDRRGADPRVDTARAPQPGQAYPQQSYPQGYPQVGSQAGDAPRPPAVIMGAPSAVGSTGTAPAAAMPGQQQGQTQMLAALPPEDQPEIGEPKELPPHLQRQLVDYTTKEPVGTLIIDTPNTYLYLVLPNGKAMRYGIGVGREGFTWAGSEKVSRMAEWPDWHPPAEMIERQPYLPRFMAGGEGNPLGARALYLGKTLYRIHGTNQPSTIGTFVSSGCVRLTNKDVMDLYDRVKVGAKVVVLPGNPPATAQANPPVSIAPQTVSTTTR